MTSSLTGARSPMSNRTGAPVGHNMTGTSQLQGNVVPKGYSQGQFQNYGPETMQLFQQLLGHLGPESQISKLAGGDQSQFEQLEKPARREFGEQQSNLANRFAGLGSFGGLSSSGHELAQNSAASNFAEKLAANRMGLQRQAMQDLFGMSQNIFSNQPYENFLVKESPKERPFWQELLGAGAGGLGQGIGSALGGGASGAASAGLEGIISLLQKLLSGQGGQSQQFGGL